jgi:hypothetical protein
LDIKGLEKNALWEIDLQDDLHLEKSLQGVKDKKASNNIHG